MARFSNLAAAGPTATHRLLQHKPTHGHNPELPILTLRPGPRPQRPRAFSTPPCESERASARSELRVSHSTRCDPTEAALQRTETRRPRGFERRSPALWALAIPSSTPCSCTHCHDPDARAWTETHSLDRATKIRVCTASREGNRTPANQGAFHLRRVSFERSESLPRVRPRLIPFYAGACPFRSRCHCKRGIRAFVTPADAWA